MPDGSANPDPPNRSADPTSAEQVGGNTVPAPGAAPVDPRRDFEQFAAFYLDRLYAFARRLTGDAHLAEDVVQEVLVRAYQKPPAPGAGMEQWMFTVTRNVALNAVRSRSRRRTRPLDDCPDQAAEDGTGRRLEADERTAAIKAALAGLPEEQRVAILLAKYHGFSCGHIAGLLGCSTSAVKMRISRGMRRLREALVDCETSGGT